MKSIIFAIAFLSLFACQDAKRFSVPNVAMKYEIKFQPKAKETYLLKIKVDGKLNGSAKLVIMQIPDVSAVPFEIILHEGINQSNYNLDWYQNSGKIIYTPENCTNGFLNISLKFVD